MARRAAGRPKELVRLSPFQFSLSISIVVILLAGAGLAGYYYGKKQSGHGAAVSAEGLPPSAMEEEVREGPAGTQASVTFYSTLTKTRRDSSPAKNAVPVKPSEKQSPAAVAAPADDPGIRKSSPAEGSVMLQVASYRDEGNARKLLQELSSEGYTGSILRADLGERGIWYRVRVGPYAAGEADKLLGKLREERKLKGFVVN